MKSGIEKSTSFQKNPAANPVKVFLVELTHTFITVDAKNTPLAIGYLAGYLKKHLHSAVSVELFKYPRNLNDSLKAGCPEIIAFSNYMWNEDLSCAFAKRVKEISPGTVVVFGGPNYPVDEHEQMHYLSTHPEIDFYIEGEGEVAFFLLVDMLIRHKFESGSKEYREIAGVHCNSQDHIFTNSPAKRISDIEGNIPSPYLNGLLDEFFDRNLTPLLQTSRGCPYSCTFCHDGATYSSKTCHFSVERVKAELQYVAQRTQVPSLTLADLNWGIFPQDLHIAQEIKKTQELHGWPLSIQTATDKNNKERIVEMSRVLGNAMIIGASIQSSDEDVLKNVKRQNIGYVAIVKMAKESSNTESVTFTEIILCLPGDTKEKHMKAVFDMLDAGIQDINLYQYILLPGTEGATSESRKLFEYQTAYRVIPRCFGVYDILGKEIMVTEIHEVVVGNSTMPHEDYLECRRFDLTLMLFNNGQILDELYRSIAHLGINRSAVIAMVHQRATAVDSDLYDVYEAYREDEESNFWASKNELIHFLRHEGGYDLYVSGDRGRNQLHYWKSVVIFSRLASLLDCAVSCVKEILIQKGLLNSVTKLYLDELTAFILLKKGDPTLIHEAFTCEASFDFSALEKSAYAMNPFEEGENGKYRFRLAHREERKKNILAYFDQYGSDLRGLAHLTHRYPARILHREVELIGQT
ncbi:MAG: radical SAM protein [Chlorobiaceae bacterium]